ncbi:MAG: hypothetical protein ACOYXB_16840 [Bacteroidota bacterium]
MKRLLVFVLPFLFLLPLAGQETGVTVPERSYGFNSLSLTAGFFPVYGSIHLAYEMVFEKGPERYIRYMGVKAQTGVWALWEDSGWELTTTCFWLMGRKNLSMEAGAGFTYLEYFTTDDWHLLPAGNLGLRYMKPGSPFFFRAGFGFPECVYFGGGMKIGGRKHGQ